MAPGAGRVARAGVEQRVERGLGVERDSARQPHVGRHDAVEHRAAHRAGLLAHQLERDAGAVRDRDDVDLRRAERLPHRVEVCGLGRGVEVAQVVDPAEQGRARQRVAAGQQVRDLGIDPGQRVGRRPAVQRRAGAGAARVDQHQVALAVERRQQMPHLPGQRDRALPRPAGDEEHRVGARLARQRRQHRHLQRDLPALGARRVERARQRAAARLALDARQAAGLEDQRSRHRRRRGGQRQRAGQRGQRRPGRPADAQAPAHPSSRCSSPLASSFSVSAAPPISVPRTKTIGKVGQPVHIFSALRRRHSPK